MTSSGGGSLGRVIFGIIFFGTGRRYRARELEAQKCANFADGLDVPEEQGVPDIGMQFGLKPAEPGSFKPLGRKGVKRGLHAGAANEAFAIPLRELKINEG